MRRELEYELEHYIEERDEKIYEALKNKKWYTNDWRLLDIRKMSIRHIENSVLMISREKLYHLADYIPIFKEELLNRNIQRGKS